MAKTDKIISALLVCNTHREAAARAGISETTLYKYLKDPDFLKRYDEELQNITHGVAAKLRKYMGEAVDVLHTTATSESTGAPAKVAAARAILDYGLRLIELEEIKKRIDELEERLR